MSKNSNHICNLVLTASTAAVILGVGLSALPKATTNGGLHQMFDGKVQRNIERSFEDALPIKKLSQQAWTAFRIALFNEGSSGVLIGDNDILFTLEEFVAPQDAPVFQDELLAVQDKLGAFGSRLVPVIVPDKSRILSSLHDFPRSAELWARFDMLLKILAQNGFAAIDARTVLEPLGADAFLRTDTHWTPEGARTVAGLILEIIPDLFDSAGGFETVETGTTLLNGDLIVFTDAGPFSVWLGQEQETITTYKTAVKNTSLALFADTDIKVVLVGTSYSARNDLHFEGFLKSAINQDVLNLSVEGLGPFKPMHEFLNSDALHASPPDFVIWEIPERYINPRRLK